jgi:hypothetical protein
MKRLYTILSLLFFTLSVSAQNNVFVLVDVSKSVKQDDLLAAKQALNEIFLGSTPSNSNVVGGSLQDLQQFKIAVGDRVSILKFGNQQTTLNINPTPIQVSSLPNDVNSALNSFPIVPTDNNTYFTLAKAKVAEYAKKNNLSKYVLCIVSDENEDNFGPGGKPNYNSSYIQELVDNYNTKTNQAKEEPAILTKFNSSTQGFKLRFIPSIDVSKYNIPGGSTPPPPLPGKPASITLTSFANGKKDKPVPTGSNSFTVSWTCGPNCPPNAKFNVMLTEIGGKYKDKQTVTSNTWKFSNVPSGSFKVVVTASGIGSATTFVETPSGGYGWLIFLLILIVGGLIGYYFWNKRRQEKIDVFATNKADDIFSKNTGSSTTGNSSNSDYF